jgi:hypothetical protein
MPSTLRQFAELCDAYPECTEPLNSASRSCPSEPDCIHEIKHNVYRLWNNVMLFVFRQYGSFYTSPA